MQSASADPQTVPRTLNGGGSDTTQDVMNALSEVVTVGGVKVIASWNATGSATVDQSGPSATGCDSVARPNGSGAGRTALIASQQSGGDQCYDFSRSSSLSLGASAVPLTYVPYALDSVTYAVNATSSISKSLTKDDLVFYYTCGDSSVVPIIPQAGSGTRSFWLSYLGITETQITNGTYPCIKDKINNVSVEEHDGRLLKDNMLMPFSVPKYLTESTGVIADVHGATVLGSIDGALPAALNADYSVTRTVYNVIPTSQIATAPYSNVFVGSGSAICQNSATIKNYGFGTVANCGDTSLHT